MFIFKVLENEQDIKGVIITAGEILGNTNDKVLRLFGSCLFLTAQMLLRGPTDES
jgi:hypothetical protein